MHKLPFRDGAFAFVLWDLVTVAIHAVTAGPQKAIRLFQVWQKGML